MHWSYCISAWSRSWPWCWAGGKQCIRTTSVVTIAKTRCDTTVHYSYLSRCKSTKWHVALRRFSSQKTHINTHKHLPSEPFKHAQTYKQRIHWQQPTPFFHTDSGKQCWKSFPNNESLPGFAMDHPKMLEREMDQGSADAGRHAKSSKYSWSPRFRVEAGEQLILP